MQTQGVPQKGIAMRIREARGDATQTAFATQVGASLRTVQYWEAGRVTPRVRQLRALARATGRPVDFFLQDEEEDEEGDLEGAIRRFVRQEIARLHAWDGLTDRRRPAQAEA